MIEAKHGEHKIQYDEASNTWSCRAMKCDAPSLAELRTKLNAEDREDHRISNIRAYSLDRGYEGEAAEIVITMIDTGRHGVNGYRVGNSTKKREYFGLNSFVILNEKNAPKIERYRKAGAAADAAQKEVDAARTALPRPTIEELKKLSRAALYIHESCEPRRRLAEKPPELNASTITRREGNRNALAIPAGLHGRRKRTELFNLRSLFR